MALLPALLGGPAAATSTVSDIVQAALRSLGVLASGEVPSASEQSDGFSALNDMLDAWANERLALFATARNTYTLTPGHNPHTIGSGGDFDTTRPVRIDRASIVLAGQTNSELPLSVISDDEWQGLQGKTSSGTPLYLWVETSYPLERLWLNPLPAAADSLVLYTWQQLGRFSSTSTGLDLPPGYSRAIRLNLALELAPEFGVEPSPTLLANATAAKADLKRVNTKAAYLRSDPAVLASGGFNLVSGDR